MELIAKQRKGLSYTTDKQLSLRKIGYERVLFIIGRGVGAVTGSVVNLVVANAGDTLYQTTKNMMVLYLEVEGFFNDAFKEAEEEYAQKSGKSETTVQKECQDVGNEMNEAVEAITIAAEVTTMAV